MTQLDNDSMLQAMQQSLTKKRVLLIDRHAPARDSLRLMLGNLGVIQVHGAGSSAEVIRQVKGTRFDIILSDFILDDGRDGQQLLEELRHAHLIPLSTLYMIITSERAYSNVVALAELAPDDFLIKPFTADQLQARLIKSLYRKHVLHRIYAAIERGALQDAVACCDKVLSQHPAYSLDALRFKGELLMTLGKTTEAEAVYQQVLASRAVPWANMGLAAALRDRKELKGSAQIVEKLLEENPQFLAAYDFLASIHEAMGDLNAAQVVLQRGADASPHNTLRQRLVGDIAMRNEDHETAERAYSRVMERSRGSSLRAVDDYANLTRTLIERDQLEASRKLSNDLRREWRGDKQAEMSALALDAMSFCREGQIDKASDLVERALALQEEAANNARETGKHLSPRLLIDLAHACYQSNNEEAGNRLMRQVAAEHNEDPHILAHIKSVFAKTGNEHIGQSLLDEVGREIIELNNRGVMAARRGDLKGSVELLIQAAEQVPNMQFLVNASKAIFSLLNQQGWDETLAAKGATYLQQAMKRDRKNAKVASARELALTVAKKYGVFLEM